ncbi:MAG: TonB-dependent receptor plug domain-containing protein, partial [Pseudomonadota bacterium]|nr:TonB-dependent receptor plug domain-containing protein [Pseudomonadota bacterium]
SSTQFEMSNSVNVESLINSMPQVVGGADRSSTFGQGIATANLRGLDENRTLVLVNNNRQNLCD